MTDAHTQHDHEDEQSLAGLISRSGARPQPSQAATDAIRRAVHAEWERVVAGRRRSRRIRWALAAAAAALMVWVGVPVVRGPAAMMASVARVTGPVQMDGGGLLARWTPVRQRTRLPVGAEIRTGPGGRVALQIDGMSVRLDERSLIAMPAAGQIALKQGALYVDSGNQVQRTPLKVATEFGNLEHLGTQYEARLSEDAIRVRVREGRVRLTGERRIVETNEGEQVTILAAGGVRREPVALAGSEWAWAAEIAPAYDIEDRPLIEFLHWVSRETGRQVAFASPRTEEEARNVVLRGSVQGLTPERALSAVLATTRLGYTKTPGRLLIDFKTGDR